MTDLDPLESLYFAALERATADRPAYLDEACRDKPELRERVERLLAAKPQIGEFLQPPAATITFSGDREQATVDYPGRDERIGAILAGKYKLIEAIGEGGMGSVFMAQQTQPVKRRVAVKVIKAGMDSKAVLSRFEAERQALAMMDHPNIAKVLDAGTTESGRPYFVMELVKGVPITEYCDERKLTPRQRLELFVPVCNAIQHAHMKGVIHRDIKPSNVLVAMYDDKPVPKVIDFGVAKATGASLTDHSLITGHGAVVGTPEYMSPEQANLNNLDIDTRSDVYSLGVLLYELLTGTTPVDRKSLGKAALLEVLRIVREVEAPRPSARLSTADAVASLSADRGTDPKKLTGLLRNELDWIVVKALEKDRTRRYESANGFAADVQRYLCGEAVQAVPPSFGYRVKKAYRRNRTAVRVVGAFMLLMLVSIAVSSWLAVKATRAEAVADEKRVEAEVNANRAQEESENAAYFNGLAVGTSESLKYQLQKSKLVTASLQIDLDLAEVRMYEMTGILRLVRSIQSLPTIDKDSQDLIDRRKALREFVTAAVLTIGQNYAPLLPPISHDGFGLTDWQLSSTGQRLVNLGEDGTARLWDARTAKPIATLRRATERVLHCGLSPDGKTAFTDAPDGVVRLWDTADGAYRAETEPRLLRICNQPDGNPDAIRPYRERLHEITQLSNDRVLTRSVVMVQDKFKINPPEFTLQGPIELWGSQTGRLIARMDDKERSIDSFRFDGDGRWISANEGKSTTVVFDAQNGRELARLKHDPEHATVGKIYPSPHGGTLATIGQLPARAQSGNGYYVYLWDTGTWHLSSVTGPCNGTQFSSWLLDDHYQFKFINVDGQSFIFNGDNAVDGTWAYRFGDNKEIASLGVYTFSDVNPQGGRVLTNEGPILDTRTWQRIPVPAGQRYSTDLIQFAEDGRFTAGGIDTRSEKTIAGRLGSYFSGIGWTFADQGYKQHGVQIHRLPTPDQLNFPPAMLELWAQVAVRGELGPEGTFVKWDEATWEKKRQELAAIPPPHPDFPFPGYVATDKLHWLRAEYEAAAEKDKLRLATDLLRRAEASSDKVEAVRWRAERAKFLREVAPLPREKKLSTK